MVLNSVSMRQCFCHYQLLDKVPMNGERKLCICSIDKGVEFCLTVKELTKGFRYMYTPPQF